MHPSVRLPFRAVFRCTMLGTAVLAIGSAGIAGAQQTMPTVLDPVVVSATRNAERAFDLPVAIDTVTTDQIQRGQRERGETSVGDQSHQLHP